MKVGTLLKSLDYDDVGVVYKTTRSQIFIHWGKSNKKESIYIMDLNKWIIGGYLKVIETRRTDHEQSTD
tara:strand:+ start:8476 stop:8682 length:207 start_codon:yes stop_codon:yes gene_type:complete